MIAIIAIHLEGGCEPEHITHLQWQASASSGVTTMAALARWMQEDPRHRAVVAGADGDIEVEEVLRSDGSIHVRSVGDHGERLLNLPRF